jgi:hypothetical protein
MPSSLTVYASIQQFIGPYLRQLPRFRRDRNLPIRYTYETTHTGKDPHHAAGEGIPRIQRHLATAPWRPTSAPYGSYSPPFLHQRSALYHTEPRRLTLGFLVSLAKVAPSYLRPSYNGDPGRFPAASAVKTLGHVHAIESMTDEGCTGISKMPRQAGGGAAVKMRKLLGNFDWAQGGLQHLPQVIDGIEFEHIEVIHPRKQEHPPRRRLDKP